MKFVVATFVAALGVAKGSTNCVATDQDNDDQDECVRFEPVVLCSATNEISNAWLNAYNPTYMGDRSCARMGGIGCEASAGICAYEGFLSFWNEVSYGTPNQGECFGQRTLITCSDEGKRYTWQQWQNRNDCAEYEDDRVANANKGPTWILTGETGCAGSDSATRSMATGVLATIVSVVAHQLM